jgi:hypothetical protein
MPRWMRVAWWPAALLIGMIILDRINLLQSHWWVALLAYAALGLILGVIGVAIQKKMGQRSSEK